MDDQLIKVRAAGYEWGLRGNDGYINTRAHRVIGVPEPTVEDCPYTGTGCEVCKAFAKGLTDGYAVYAFEIALEQFMTVDETATFKSVAPNTLYRLLRDKRRQELHFSRSVSRGNGNSTEWRLHRRDVEDWKPAVAMRR